MNILLVAGPDANSVRSVWQTLENLGVRAAKASRREGLLPQNIHDLMNQVLSHPVADEDDSTNLAPSSRVLGHLWHELAADLWLGNIGHPLWGWPMPDDPRLLDYWLEFDPNVRLVLTYISPVEHLQHGLQGTTEITPSVIEQAMAQWSQQVEALLACFHGNSPRCLLVHASSVQRQPAQLAHAMHKQWAIHGVAYTANAVSDPDNPSATASQSLLAQMVSAYPAAELLWQELEATANVASGISAAPVLTIYQHWAQQSKLTDTQAALDAAIRAKNEQSKELLALQTKLSDTKAALDAAIHTKNEQSKQLLAQAEQARQSLVENTELSRENELMLLQLHQVQEELEHYFLQYQDATQKYQTQLHPLLKALEFWHRHPPQAITLNLCEDIDGQNWYDPETDGRWAGPGLVSTLQMPPMPAGCYRLELHIKDAMQPEIVLDQKIFALVQNNESAEPIDLTHDFAQYGDLYPMVSIGMLELPNQQQPWTLQFSLPNNISPADTVGDDTRRLGIKLQAVRLIRQNQTADLIA